MSTCLFHSSWHRYRNSPETSFRTKICLKSRPGSSESIGLSWVSATHLPVHLVILLSAVVQAGIFPSQNQSVYIRHLQRGIEPLTELVVVLRAQPQMFRDANESQNTSVPIEFMLDQPSSVLERRQLAGWHSPTGPGRVDEFQHDNPPGGSNAAVS